MRHEHLQDKILELPGKDFKVAIIKILIFLF